MDRREVDVAIIGAGTAGLNARRAVCRLGKSWVLIDPGPLGTTCARVGCMPSKLLIAAADAAHDVARASLFGVEVDEGAWRVNARAVFDRVRRERDRFVRLIVEGTEALPEDRLLRHPARFIGPTTLQVGDDLEVEARAVVIATGSRPWLPPPFDAIAEHVMVSDDVFELDALPSRLAVIGTGIIGLELGQALQRLGSRVTFLNPFDALGPFSDPALKACARDVLGAELDLRLGSTVDAAQPVDAGVSIAWRDADGSPHTETFSHVLVAAGRRPHLASLNLEATGADLDRHGVPAHDDRTMQCPGTPLFIAGDACGHHPLLHEAADEGGIAGDNAARYPNHVAAAQRRADLAVAFTHPQMAMVGARFADLAEGSFQVGEVRYRDQGRARVMGIDQGLVRLYARCSDQVLLGAEMFGPRVEHTAHLLAWAVQSRQDIPSLLRMPVYHPVIEEGIRAALRDLSRKLDTNARCPPEDLAMHPGN